MNTNVKMGARRAGLNLVNKRSAITLGLASVILALAAPQMKAQSNVNGSIYGNVASPVAGSSITVVNVDTGLKRTVTLDTKGSYQLTALPPGRYKATLTAPGQSDVVFEDIRVNVGSGTDVSFAAPSAVKTDENVMQLEAMKVSGATISPIDTTSVESVTILHMDTITQVPVERDTSSVALLAPGTSQGVAAFGKLVSFGGSSVAENAYYVNGFNLTNFRNGLGGGTVPFEFYDQFEVKTGGYSAEFGRSTGGVINATTKRGTNTFEAGANVYYEPQFLSERSPSVSKDGTLYIDNSKNYDTTTNANVYAGGALIKNKLFYYGLVNVRDNIHHDAQGVSTWYTSKSTDPFYAGRIDLNLTDGHTLAFTAISDKRRYDTGTYDYSEATGLVGAKHGNTYSDRGGHDYILNYSGQFTSDFTLTALIGQGTASASDFNDTPYIVDSRVSPSKIVSGSSTFLSTLLDRRTSYRLDGTYKYEALGSHTLRAGFDREDTSSASKMAYAGGGIYYRYYNTAAGKKVNGATVPDGVTQYVREQIYANDGLFKTISSAYYAEDNWKTFGDRLLLSLGLRNDEFNNKNKNGESFVHLKNQWAPRIGLTYDLTGDKKTKVFGTWGRYTMPVASNTNIRFSGGEVYTQDYYVLQSVDPTTHLPVVGQRLGSHYILPGEDGSIKDPKTIVNQDLKPMYQDEIIVGAQHDFGNGWSAGVRGINREMKSFIEDIDVDLTGNGDVVDVLTNPGRPLDIWADLGDGKGLREFKLSPSQQGYGGQTYPAAIRKYYAAEFFWEKVSNKKWWLQGSYTWSHSYGNDEGVVLSDIGQADAGLTELFDWPQIMDGRYGNLSNDHRHRFKLFGAYKITSEFDLGANWSLQSGTPKIAIGYYPGSDSNITSYGAAYFYRNGVVVPRGSLGTTPWVDEVDLSAHYTPNWAKGKIVFGLDVYNVLNEHKALQYYSYAESGGVGIANAQYDTVSVYQNPLYVRISFSYKY